MFEGDAQSAGEQNKPRAAARRRQIVEAAAKCFRQYGFHSASMAQIAVTAGMSVGHIYRYFSGKEAIIAAIVQEQVGLALSSFPANNIEAGDVPGMLRQTTRRAARRGFDREWSVLMHEIRAEATRNDAIADIVRAADTEVASRVYQLVVAGFPSNAVPDDIDQRIAMLGLAIEGVTFRAVAQPLMDVRAIDALLDLVIDHIFSVSAPT